MGWIIKIHQNFGVSCLSRLQSGDESPFFMEIFVFFSITKRESLWIEINNWLCEKARFSLAEINTNLFWAIEQYGRSTTNDPAKAISNRSFPVVRLGRTKLTKGEEDTETKKIMVLMNFHRRNLYF